MIQPLDSKYKTRYDNTYKNAIKKAGLVPYRVDEHYDSERLLIKTIQDEIKDASVCLAEISEQNPNVWYEIGFADGHNTPVVFICDIAKKSNLPFDVNQRHVYFYGTESQGDWEKLEISITERLQIAAKPRATAHEDRSDETQISTNQTQFGEIELHALSHLYYDAENTDNIKSKFSLREVLEKKYDKKDITDAFNLLEYKNLVKDFPPQIYRNMPRIGLTPKGKSWCLKNKHTLRNLEN